MRNTGNNRRALEVAVIALFVGLVAIPVLLRTKGPGVSGDVWRIRGCWKEEKEDPISSLLPDRAMEFTEDTLTEYSFGSSHGPYEYHIDPDANPKTLDRTRMVFDEDAGLDERGNESLIEHTDKWIYEFDGDDVLRIGIDARSHARPTSFSQEHLIVVELRRTTKAEIESSRFTWNDTSSNRALAGWDAVYEYASRVARESDSSDLFTVGEGHPIGYFNAMCISLSDANIGNCGLEMFFADRVACSTHIVAICAAYERINATRMVDILKSALFLFQQQPPEKYKHFNCAEWPLEVPQEFMENVEPTRNSFEALDKLYFAERANLPGFIGVRNLHGVIDRYYETHPEDFR